MSCDGVFGTDEHEIIVFPRGIAFNNPNNCFDVAEAVEIDGNIFVKKHTCDSCEKYLKINDGPYCKIL